MEIHLDVDGVPEATETFRGLGRRATNARPAMRKIADMLMRDEKALFAEHPWTGLAASTRRRKAREGEDPRILRGANRMIHDRPTRVHDALYRALTQRGAAGQELKLNATSMLFGLQQGGPVFYGRFQQMGAGRLPRRTLLELTPRKVKRIGDAIRDHLLGR